jgi:hypothetical protein
VAEALARAQLEAVFGECISFYYLYRFLHFLGEEDWQVKGVEGKFR